MLRLSLSSASVLLLGATALAQTQVTRQSYPITAPVQYAGVYHLATGTWTQVPTGGQPVSAPAIIYDNTCTVANYGPMKQGARFIDEGRLPSTSSVVIANNNGLGNDSEVGTQDTYTVDGFQIAYCTQESFVAPAGVGYIVNFYDAYNFCAVPPATATASFSLVGLPSAPTAGTTQCWIVDIDLTDCNPGGTPLSFLMHGDADGVYNAGAQGTGDTFGWSFQLTTASPHAHDGFIISGNKPTGGSAVICSGSDGTVFDTGTVSPVYPDNTTGFTLGGGAGSPPPVCATLAAGATPENGTGMTTQDAFREENNPPNANGCYTYAAPLLGSFYLKVYTVDVILPNTIPPPVPMCDPGAAGILTCPCSNPPTGSGRGCNNSALTGGASMLGSGLSSLATPTLQFTTAGERPTSGSILVQGTTAGTGVSFGQGVRCATGVIKRLYFRNAVAGSVTLPNFTLNDLDIPTRSAAIGNPILTGQNRWYQVYYRDGNVVGGCATTLTFNITNGAQVTWQ